MRDYEDVLRAAEAASAVGAELGMQEVVDDLGAESQDVVPYDQGDLSRSMRKTVTSAGAVTVGQVSYDTVYAPYQHYDESLRHDPGRTAFFLSGPAYEDRVRHVDHLAQRVADAIGDA
ncbi:hypothetical protein [Actinokineospora globicatena]|uniref:Uncharacterized protein n=1 Tax=Actinokineospora globicatena TaxID=103729 RepID=A0A9W6V7X1_9PSEU|nr:hypothetical protein [Actinokineospora globicatena]GLW91772.1 hypothetical protein Aglo03_25880 [Actinokineospora globicatena]